MNEIVEQKKQGIATFLSSDAVKTNIVNVIGEKDAQPFISSVVSAVQANPDLAKCTNPSIFSAALLGYSLKLPQSPQLGYFYMIPYENKDKSKGGNKVYEAQFQISYKGLYQLAMRSGLYKKIVVTEIREGELVYYNPITEEIEFNPELDHDKRMSLKVIGYYAAYEMTSGAVKFIYWSESQMRKHAETYSASYRSDLKWNSKKSFWNKDFIMMARKTMLKQLLSKWGVLSVELRNALESDLAVINEDGTKAYIDNQPDEPTPAIDVETEDVEVIEGEVSEN